jgi:hypothetical protein
MADVNIIKVDVREPKNSNWSAESLLTRAVKKQHGIDAKTLDHYLFALEGPTEWSYVGIRNGTAADGYGGCCDDSFRLLKRGMAGYLNGYQSGGYVTREVRLDPPYTVITNMPHTVVLKALKSL